MFNSIAMLFYFFTNFGLTICNRQRINVLRFNDF